MTIQAFPTTPAVSYGVSPKKSYRILVADFGDGYSQRTPDGLNVEMQSMTMVWEYLTYAEAQIIKSFLDSCQGSQAFSYQAPNDTLVRNWNCAGGWTEKPYNASYTTISATFTRVYDLD